MKFFLFFVVVFVVLCFIESAPPRFKSGESSRSVNTPYTVGGPSQTPGRDAVACPTGHCTNTETFECSDCDRTYKSLLGLKYHIEHSHLSPVDRSPEMKMCPDCGRSIVGSYLNRHRKMRHSNFERVCTFEGCGKVFKNNFKLGKHKSKVHANERDENRFTLNQNVMNQNNDNEAQVEEFEEEVIEEGYVHIHQQRPIEQVNDVDLEDEIIEEGYVPIHKVNNIIEILDNEVIEISDDDYVEILNHSPSRKRKNDDVIVLSDVEDPLPIRRRAPSDIIVID